MNIPALWRRRQMVGLLGATVALPALAQFRVEVTGVGLTQMPIAIAPLRGEAAAPQKLAAIVQADLERSGQFRAIDAAGAALDETSRPDLTPWRQKGADSLAVGQRHPAGRRPLGRALPALGRGARTGPGRPELLPSRPATCAWRRTASPTSSTRS